MIQKHLEHKRIHQINVLFKMFQELDDDGSGNLSKAEFLDCLDDPMFCTRITSLDISLDDLPDVFAICDDGDGIVEARVLQNKIHMYMETIFNQCRNFKKEVKDVNELIADVMEAMIARTVESVADTCTMIRDFPRVPKRPTEKELKNPNFRLATFQKNEKRFVNSKIKSGLAVPMTLDTQLLWHGPQGTPSESPEASDAETEIVPRSDGGAPTPPPSALTAEVGTQTRW